MFLSPCNDAESKNESITVELTPLRVAVSKKTYVELVNFPAFCFSIYGRKIVFVAQLQTLH